MFYTNNKRERKSLGQKLVGVGWCAFFGYFLFTQKKVTSKMGIINKILNEKHLLILG